MEDRDNKADLPPVCLFVCFKNESYFLKIQFLCLFFKNISASLHSSLSLLGLPRALCPLELPPEELLKKQNHKALLSVPWLPSSMDSLPPPSLASPPLAHAPPPKLSGPHPSDIVPSLQTCLHQLSSSETRIWVPACRHPHPVSCGSPLHKPNYPFPQTSACSWSPSLSRTSPVPSHHGHQAGAPPAHKSLTQSITEPQHMHLQMSLASVPSLTHPSVPSLPLL